MVCKESYYNSVESIASGTVSYSDTELIDDNELVVQFAGLKPNSINYSFADKRRTTKISSISPRLRWTVNIAALASNLFFGGILYGWAPLKLILMQENQFASLCSVDDNAQTLCTARPEEYNASLCGNYSQKLCPAQLEEYNAIFTAAQFLLNFPALPVGIFLDRAPSKAVYYGATAVLQLSGLLLFGTSDATAVTTGTSNHFYLASILMALGGCMTMLGAFPASFLLPEVQAGLLASISCLFNASSILFTVFHQLNNINDTLFSRQNLFYALAAWGVVVYSVLIYGWYQLEKHNWAAVIKEEAKQLQKQQKVDKDIESNGQLSSAASSTWNMDLIGRLRLHEWSARHQLGSLEFGLVAIFLSIQITRCNFFIETVNELLLTYGDFHSRYATLFSYVLPAGVVFVPLIESSVQLLGCVGTMHVTNAIGAVFGMLLLVPSLPLQAVNFVIFACFRAFMYATLNTFIAFSFGVQTMGCIIGCTFTSAAMVTLVQYPAAALVEKGTAGDGAADFTLINSLMLFACLVPTALALGYSCMLWKTAEDGEGGKDGAKTATVTTISDERMPLLME